MPTTILPNERVYPGQVVRVSCAFTLSGVATDPTTVTLVVRKPDGTQSTYTYSGSVSKLSTGNYYKDLTFDVDGLWKLRWVGTGTVGAVDEAELQVRRSEFA